MVSMIMIMIMNDYDQEQSSYSQHSLVSKINVLNQSSQSVCACLAVVL